MVYFFVTNLTLQVLKPILNNNAIWIPRSDTLRSTYNPPSHMAYYEHGLLQVVIVSAPVLLSILLMCCPRCLSLAQQHRLKQQHLFKTSELERITWFAQRIERCLKWVGIPNCFISSDTYMSVCNQTGCSRAKKFETYRFRSFVFSSVLMYCKTMLFCFWSTDKSGVKISGARRQLHDSI